MATLKIGTGDLVTIRPLEFCLAHNSRHNPMTSRVWERLQREAVVWQVQQARGCGCAIIQDYVYRKSPHFVSLNMLEKWDSFNS